MNKKELISYILVVLLPGGLLALSVYWLSQYCKHDFSRVYRGYTIRKGETEKVAISYKNCMKCSRSFEYDWQNMRLGKVVTVCSEPFLPSKPQKRWLQVSSGLESEEVA